VAPAVDAERFTSDEVAVEQREDGLGDLDLAAPAAKRRGLFDGSKLLPDGAGLWRYWAFGTYRQNGCYFTADGSCGMQMVWHVGGPKGFNTRSVPNGFAMRSTRLSTRHSGKSVPFPICYTPRI